MPTAPSRADLSAPGVRVLHQGGPNKADLLLVPGTPAPVVVKDFARKRAWTRLLGRIQIRREAANYRALGGIDGVPVFHGRVDRHALCLEYLRGKSLHLVRRRAERGSYFRQLAGIMAAMHARGVIHNDLRGRDNAFVTENHDRVVLLDFAGAVCLRPGTLLHRLLFSLLVKVDRAALLKWKIQLVPEAVTGEEKAFLRRFDRWRRLWMFNPKGYGPGRKAAP